MNNGKLVSIKQVADRLLQNPVMSDVTWEFIVSNAVECMRIVGTKPMFVSETETIEIKNFRGDLPINMIKLVSAMKVEDNGLVPMSSNEDTLATHYGSFSSSPTSVGGDKYSLNNSKIFPTFEKGKVVLVYDTIATDEECFPLIPDNPELLRAIRLYIRYQWFDILNDMDKISGQKLNKAETEYAYAVGQAQSNLQMPTEDEMETLVNSITQILPSRTQHADRFRFLGKQEFMKIQ
jgi:hypothetical protein